MSNVIRENDSPEPGPQKQIFKKGAKYLLKYNIRGKDITENIGSVTYPEAKTLLRQRTRVANDTARTMGQLGEE